MTVHVAADVEKLCELMVRYGVTRLEWSGLTLERPAALAMAEAAAKLSPAKDDEPEAQDEELAKLRGMSPEAQDAALTLAPLR